MLKYLIIIAIAAVLGHEWGVSNVAKECRERGEFTNGKIHGTDSLEVYKCQPGFDPAIWKSSQQRTGV